MGRVMKDTLYLITALALLSSTVGWFWVTLDGGCSDSCGLGSDVIVAGLSATTDTTSAAKAEGYIMVGRYPLEANGAGCQIDTAYLYMNSSFGSGEYIVVGIYHDKDDDDTATLVTQSGQVEGNGVGESKTFALNDTITWCENGTHGDELYIAWHVGGAGASVTSEYTNNVAWTVQATKDIDRGSYSSTMPPTIDVSSMIADYAWRANVQTP
jgi:hypothetical protein